MLNAPTAQINDTPSRAYRLSDLPENVLSIDVNRRSWSGIRVDVNTARYSGRVLHHLCYENETRLGIVLEECGSWSEPRLSENRPCGVDYVTHQMQVVPAGMPLWGYSPDMRRTTDATISFDLPVLQERFGDELDWAQFERPRLCFADDRLWSLGKLLTDAIEDPDPGIQLFGDGLIIAIISLLLNPGTTPVAAHGLAPWQLRRVMDYLETHLSTRIGLTDLASVVGLSPSRFSHAFKAATGTSPYRWQLEQRVKRAQLLLLDPRHTIADAATATGFADTVHFTRMFKNVVGNSPAKWRRSRTD